MIWTLSRRNKNLLNSGSRGNPDPTPFCRLAQEGVASNLAHNAEQIGLLSWTNLQRCRPIFIKIYITGISFHSENTHTHAHTTPCSLGHFCCRYEEEINKRTTAENEFVVLKKVRSGHKALGAWRMGGSDI